MRTYETADAPDLRCYPNYSFEIGDLDGDGQMEMVALNQNGNRLRAVKLNGEVVLEQRIINFGNWGTPLIVLADLDGDGREEIVVPDLSRKNRRKEARIVVIDAEGNEVTQHYFGTFERDDYGIAVPLLARFRFQRDDRPGIVAALAGGHVVALDGSLSEVWRVTGFRRDFGHEFYVSDVDGDGLDEVAFCTLDHIDGGGREWNQGELVILDHDGGTILRRSTRDFFNDSHFDDVALADFRGAGRIEMLLEKGVLAGLDGRIIWNVSDQFDHGQWIAHAPEPDGPGRRVFISELWGRRGRSAIFTSDGEKVGDTARLPWTRLDEGKFPGWAILPTRAHAIQWTPESEPEFFIAEQTCAPTSHDAFVTREFDLRAFFLDLDGNLIEAIPFRDAQIEGYWYNGEVRSRVADVDGDGRQEIVFPKQDGHVMMIRRREG